VGVGGAPVVGGAFADTRRLVGFKFQHQCLFAVADNVEAVKPTFDDLLKWWGAIALVLIVLRIYGLL
jgi:hypothetical protein